MMRIAKLLQDTFHSHGRLLNLCRFQHKATNDLEIPFPILVTNQEAKSHLCLSFYLFIMTWVLGFKEDTGPAHKGVGSGPFPSTERGVSQGRMLLELRTS